MRQQPIRIASHLIHFGLLLPALVMTASTCANRSLVPNGGTLALGTWGGENAGVIVTDSAAHVHVGCTFGDVPGQVALGPDGRFAIDGSYVLRAYPIMVGPALPAQFSGRVVGRTLTLAIAVNDTVEKKVVALGPITVTYGREPQMGPCPICRKPGSPAPVRMRSRSPFRSRCGRQAMRTPSY